MELAEILSNSVRYWIKLVHSGVQTECVLAVPASVYLTMDVQLQLQIGVSRTEFVCPPDNLVKAFTRSTKLYLSVHQRPRAYAIASCKWLASVRVFSTAHQIEQTASTLTPVATSSLRFSVEANVCSLWINAPQGRHQRLTTKDVALQHRLDVLTWTLQVVQHYLIVQIQVSLRMCALRKHKT